MNQTFRRRIHSILGITFILFLPTSVQAKNFFLTIGGGYLPSGNQASLERNVLYFQRILGERFDSEIQHDIYFADGNDSGADLQVMDRMSVPEPNRLMAEFFCNAKKSWT
ncbi:hypothetical protein N9C08_03580 [Rubripirellula sp.]|nr:hypothetical protein [Rubripirellula sp.]